MALNTHRTGSGYLLPSIHSFPPFFTQQKNVATQATSTDQWIRLILSYARHHRIFYLSIGDAEDAESVWKEVLRNERISRRVLPEYLSFLIEELVSKGQAAYEPPKQNRSVTLYWKTPEEWGETLHEWVTSTGQLNTILTFYELSNPPIPTSFSGLPDVILRRAVTYLSKSARAQVIAVTDGEGVRFFAGNSSRRKQEEGILILVNWPRADGY
ncbi:ESCRT-II complex vps25 subunit [Pyrrhoderma noxium]|uniref:ESCRT-II complex vps25 subunit n=1 Tax=Pyrrhoderma noxium TaxID=2282107 RepID=A0A286UKL0_9AGAM|nr:ESCRT-II complex vps25 subunit [Pyrrhoderma noxium]